MTLRLLAIAAVVGLVVMLALGRAEARDKYLSTIVQESPNTTPFTLLKPGKVLILPSTKPGDGGMVIKLILRKVDCPTIGNFKGKAGKCGETDVPADSPVNNHVLDLGVRALGTDLPSATLDASAAGLLFRYEKGKVIFQASGKNKLGVGSAFGALSSLIYDQPLGIGLIKLRTAASNPADCSQAPLLPGNGCNDGDIYAFAGITVATDPGTTCTTDSECGVTAICQAGLCTAEPCTTDAECNEGGGVGGTGECGSNGTCCDPNLDTTCASQVP